MANEFIMQPANPAGTTVPLFHPDMPALQSRLRLSGIANNEDAFNILSQAVETVRVGFYEELGIARINEILDTPYQVNPIYPEQLIRSKAASVEIAWVRLLLLRTMPNLFIDAGASAPEMWNQEGLVRDSSRFITEKEIKRLEQEVNNGLAELAGREADAGDLNVSTIGPDVAPSRPPLTLGLNING